MVTLPTYFVSHGGGPWPWMADRAQHLDPLAQSLRQMTEDYEGAPKAILMISGHWEGPEYAVMHSANPPMVYDYYNFPPETYEIVYPAPGAPEIAEQAADLIRGAGLPTRLDDEQGFDHGTFVPAYVMYPKANVPLFQVSMRSHYDPAEHFELGRALAPLRDQGVLIVGSGLSYHNLRLLGPESRAPSEAFDLWLTETLALPPAERTHRIIDWESAPHARTCHAREDHLVPLFAALGAAEDDKATRTYHQKEVFGGLTASSFRFG